MRESPFRLHDKTVMLFGPGHTLTQGIATYLNEQGADVAFIGPEASSMRKFADNLMDNRQVNQAFGRATSFESKHECEKDDLEAISQVAQSLGGVEVLIDTYLDPDFSEENSLRERMARSTLQFLESRKRGRIVFLVSQYQVVNAENFELKLNDLSSVQALLRRLKTPTSDKNVSINALAVGVTEEFLLKNFPKLTLKESIEGFKKTYPGFNIVENMEVAAAATFLASPISSGVSCEILQVNRALNISN
jgi:enoyl-[acyl-carrier-protein] reductase (NADH)